MKTKDLEKQGVDFSKITIKAEYICTFENFQQWVNKASTWIGKFRNIENIICIDKEGNSCHIGEDFMCARDSNLFPVKAYRLIRTKESMNE